MSEAAKIMQEAWRKIKVLQDNCLHEEVTDWFIPHWTPGFPRNYSIRTCKRCDKEIDRLIHTSEGTSQ